MKKSSRKFAVGQSVYIGRASGVVTSEVKSVRVKRGCVQYKLDVRKNEPEITFGYTVIIDYGQGFWWIEDDIYPTEDEAFEHHMKESAKALKEQRKKYVTDLSSKITTLENDLSKARDEIRMFEVTKQLPATVEDACDDDGDDEDFA